MTERELIIGLAKNLDRMRYLFQFHNFELTADDAIAIEGILREAKIYMAKFDYPFVSFGYKQLVNRPIMMPGQIVTCKHCGKPHALLPNTSCQDSSLLFVKCGDVQYLATVNGHLVENFEPVFGGK